MSFFSSIWDVLWTLFSVFVFVGYLIVLFMILTDLFRDRKLNGGLKALWIVLLLFVPFLTSLAYLIFRGSGMSERAAANAEASKSATENYIRSVSGGAAGEIAQAQHLLDNGTITAEEFAALKKSALNGIA